MKDLTTISSDLFNKVRSRFSNVKLGDENGEVTGDPSIARFFDINFKLNNRTLGHVNIKLDEDRLLIIYSYEMIKNSHTDYIKDSWFNFLKEMRQFARTNLLTFDTRDIALTNLKKRDYQHLSKSRNGEKEMSESKLFGTKKTSYQNIGNARVIIKHSQPVNQDFAAGRSHHIDAIYIESAAGERFKYPHRHLSGARAMARHVHNGGTAYDPIGTYISGLSEELSKLKQFKVYTARNGFVSEALDSITACASDRIGIIRSCLSSLQKQKHYLGFRESFSPVDSEDVPESVIEEWVDALTIKTFNEDLKSIFPYIYKLVNEMNKTQLSYEDLIKEASMKNKNSGRRARAANSQCITAENKLVDEYEKILNEATSFNYDNFEPALFSAEFDNEEVELPVEIYWETTPDIKVTSIMYGETELLPVMSDKKIEEIVDTINEMGADAEQGAGWFVYPRIGVEFNYHPGYEASWEEPGMSEEYELTNTYVVGNGKFVEITLPPKDRKTLNDKLYDIDFEDDVDGPRYDDDEYKEPPYNGLMYREASDPRHPEYNKADDYELPPSVRGKGTAKYRLPDYKKHDDRFKRDFQKRMDEFDNKDGLNLKEVAEFIHSFYDQKTNAFPKGNEGVAIMVGKKYGPKVEALAREMIEQLAPRQNCSSQNKELDELARIKSLAGM